jgi:hypothetical protein
MILAPNPLDLKNKSVSKKSNIRQMYYDLMRREFELLRVQDMLCDTFGDIQIFSKTHDECTPFDIMIHNAFSESHLDYQGEPYSFIIDGIFRLFFYYKEIKSDVFEYFECQSVKIVDLIFSAGKEQKAIDSKIVFLESYIQSFPHLNLTDVHKQLIKAMEVKNASV